MKNKLLSAFLCVLLVFTMCACNKNNPDETTGVEQPVASVAVAPGSLLSDPDKYILFEKDSEMGLHYVYTVSEVVTSFKFISISFDHANDDGTVVFNQGEELFGLDRLTPQKPLVIKMYIVGPIPSLAISFVDDQGNRAMYAICESGENGEPYLKLMGEGTGYIIATAGAN